MLLILRHDFLPVRSVFKGLSMHRRLQTEYYKSLKLLTQTYNKIHNKTNRNKEIQKRIGRETPKIHRAHHVITDSTSDSIHKTIIISFFPLKLIGYVTFFLYIFRIPGVDLSDRSSHWQVIFRPVRSGALLRS